MVFSKLFGSFAAPHKKFEKFLQEVIDEGIYALDRESREEMRAIEMGIPFELPMTKSDWQKLEEQNTGEISDKPITGKVMERYPFAVNAPQWHSLTTLMQSGGIGIDLEFAEEPDESTTIDIIFSSQKQNRTLRQLVDAIIADSRAHNIDPRR